MAEEDLELVEAWIPNCVILQVEVLTDPTN